MDNVQDEAWDPFNISGWEEPWLGEGGVDADRMFSNIEFDLGGLQGLRLLNNEVATSPTCNSSSHAEEADDAEMADQAVHKGQDASISVKQKKIDSSRGDLTPASQQMDSFVTLVTDVVGIDVHSHECISWALHENDFDVEKTISFLLDGGAGSYEDSGPQTPSGGSSPVLGDTTGKRRKKKTLGVSASRGRRRRSAALICSAKTQRLAEACAEDDGDGEEGHSVCEDAPYVAYGGNVIGKPGKSKSMKGKGTKGKSRKGKGNKGKSRKKAKTQSSKGKGRAKKSGKSGSASESGKSGSPSEPQKPACFICGDTSMYGCSVCKKSAYCSSKCQRQDWPTHRLDCVPQAYVAPPVPPPPLPNPIAAQSAAERQAVSASSRPSSSSSAAAEAPLVSASASASSRDSGGVVVAPSGDVLEKELFDYSDVLRQVGVTNLQPLPEFAEDSGSNSPKPKRHRKRPTDASSGERALQPHSRQPTQPLSASEDAEEEIELDLGGDMDTDKDGPQSKMATKGCRGRKHSKWFPGLSKELPISCFYKDNSKKDGLAAACKDCILRRQAKRSNDSQSTAWKSWRVSEIRKELESRGLSTAGLKRQLVTRLQENGGAPLRSDLIIASSKLKEATELRNPFERPAFSYDQSFCLIQIALFYGCTRTDARISEDKLSSQMPSAAAPGKQGRHPYLCLQGAAVVDLLQWYNVVLRPCAFRNLAAIEKSDFGWLKELYSQEASIEAPKEFVSKEPSKGLLAPKKTKRATSEDKNLSKKPRKARDKEAEPAVVVGEALVAEQDGPADCSERMEDCLLEALPEVDYDQLEDEDGPFASENSSSPPLGQVEASQPTLPSPSDQSERFQYQVVIVQDVAGPVQHSSDEDQEGPRLLQIDANLELKAVAQFIIASLANPTVTSVMTELERDAPLPNRRAVVEYVQASLRELADEVICISISDDEDDVDVDGQSMDLEEAPALDDPDMEEDSEAQESEDPLPEKSNVPKRRRKSGANPRAPGATEKKRKSDLKDRDIAQTEGWRRLTDIRPAALSDKRRRGSSPVLGLKSDFAGCVEQVLKHRIMSDGKLEFKVVFGESAGWDRKYDHTRWVHAELGLIVTRALWEYCTKNDID